MYVIFFLIWNVTAQVRESVRLFQYVVDYNLAACWFCSYKSYDFGFLMWDFHTKCFYCLV
jgi:hypothetical protein